MKENLRDATTFQAMTSVALFAVLIAGGYAVWLVQTGGHLRFQQHLLTAPWYWIPPGLRTYLQENSWMGTFVAALIAAVHFGLAAIAGVIVTAGGGALWLHKRQAEIHEATRRQSRAERPVVRPVTPVSDHGFYLSQPTVGAETILIVGDEPIRNISLPIVMRLDRANSLRLSRDPSSPVERLEAALLKTLYQHRHWTCDPAGHHSDRNLYDHSLEVAQALARKLPKEPLARVIGLAHDIGKLAAYALRKERDGSTVWDYRSKRHDKLSAHLVSLMPEFRGISEADQTTVLTVLKYSHSPTELPLMHTTQREVSIINALRKIDGLATDNDQKRIVHLIDHPDIVKAVRDALGRVLPLLNINQIRGGHAEGWTTVAHPFIAVREAVLREKIADFLTQDQIRTLGLRIDAKRGEGHPATPVIAKALTEMGLLMEEYDSIRPKGALFSLKVGVAPFYYIFLLDRDRLEADMPEVVEGWGSSTYKIRVRRRSSFGKEE